MSSLTNNAPFSLNAINLRKELVFPDGTIQSTAYTGDIGVPNLEDVLGAGSNGGGLTMTNVGINTTVAVDFNVANVNSIVFPDTSTQISAPRFFSTAQNSTPQILSSGTQYNIVSTVALPIGSYCLSGFLQNTASVSAVTDILCQTFITDGVQFYYPSFTAINSQPTTYVPTIPLNCMFRCDTAGTVFTVKQQTYFSGGTFTQTVGDIDIYYLGDN